MSETYLLVAGNLLWEILKKHGHNPADLFAEEGISQAMLREEGRRISIHSINRLWINAGKQLKDPCFGLEAAALWHPSYFGALGYGWLASRTLRRALERLERYIHIISDEEDLKLIVRDDGIELVVSAFIQPHAYMDFQLAVITRMCRLNCGEQFNPLSVNIIHEQPTCSGQYFSFFKCPVVFEAAQDSILFAKNDIDVRLPGANPHLESISDQLMVDYMASLCENDIVHRVKASVADRLYDGQVGIKDVAKDLAVSVRNLQRMLNQSGTSYAAVLKDTRKELALRLISDRRKELAEIAFQLGFSEQSAFSRAFKRWTGVAPRDYRLRL